MNKTLCAVGAAVAMLAAVAIVLGVAWLVGTPMCRLEWFAFICEASFMGTIGGGLYTMLVACGVGLILFLVCGVWHSLYESCRSHWEKP